MLKILRRKLAEASIKNVEIVQAGFLSYEHEGRPVDFVYSRFALHHLPDFWKAIALQRLRRISRLGGVFRLWEVVCNFSAAEATDRLQAWCASLPYEAQDGGWTRADIEEHIRAEHSTFTWLPEPMMERIGFRIENADSRPM